MTGPSAIKTKQQIGTVSCRKRVVEKKPAVKYQKGALVGYQTQKFEVAKRRQTFLCRKVLEGYE